MVKSPALGDPRECALHYPASGQNLKRALARGLANDLHDDPRGGLGPFHQLAGIPAVGPHQADRRERLAHRVEHRTGAVAVLDARGRDEHDQQQPDRVDDHMTLAAIDLLARVIAARRGRDGVRAPDRLCVDDRGAGLRLAPFGLPDRAAQRVVQRVQRPVIAPASKVPVHRRPRREVRRQLTPRAARAHHVEDRVDQLASRVRLRPPPRLRRRKQRLDQRPLRAGQI